MCWPLCSSIALCLDFSLDITFFWCVLQRVTAIGSRFLKRRMASSVIEVSSVKSVRRSSVRLSAGFRAACAKCVRYSNAISVPILAWYQSNDFGKIENLKNWLLYTQATKWFLLELDLARVDRSCSRTRKSLSKILLNYSKFFEFFSSKIQTFARARSSVGHNGVHSYELQSVWAMGELWGELEGHWSKSENWNRFELAGQQCAPQSLANALENSLELEHIRSWPCFLELKKESELFP